MQRQGALTISGFLVLVVSLVFSPAFAASGNNVGTTVTADEQASQQVTAYNQNLGLVKDMRAINLTSGINIVKFEDVASLIDPTSVHLKFLDGCCTVMEQNYQYDLVSQQALLQRYLGKDITLNVRISDGQQAGNYTTTTINGKLLSYDGSNFIVSTQEG